MRPRAFLLAVVLALSWPGTAQGRDDFAPRAWPDAAELPDNPLDLREVSFGQRETELVRHADVLIAAQLRDRETISALVPDRTVRCLMRAVEGDTDPASLPSRRTSAGASGATSACRACRRTAR